MRKEERQGSDVADKEDISQCVWSFMFIWILFSAAWKQSLTLGSSTAVFGNVNGCVPDVMFVLHEVAQHVRRTCRTGCEECYIPEVLLSYVCVTTRAED